MSARDDILASAAILAREQGPLGLGVERVVAHAGVSKGSFFHHFKTKDDMVAALLETVTGAFEERLEGYVGNGVPFHRALIAATIDEIRLNTGLLAAFVAVVAVDRTLARAVSERMDDWNARLKADGLSPAQAMAVRLFLDGMLLSNLLRDEPMSVDELSSLARIGETVVAALADAEEIDAAAPPRPAPNPIAGDGRQSVGARRP